MFSVCRLLLPRGAEQAYAVRLIGPSTYNGKTSRILAASVLPVWIRCFMGLAAIDLVNLDCDKPPLGRADFRSRPSDAEA